MKFIKGFSITGISQLIFISLSLINNVIITRHLGPEKRGIYSLVSYMIMFIVLLFGEGLRRSNTILSGKKSKSLKKLLTDSFFFLVVLSILLTASLINSEIWNSILPNVNKEYILIGIVSAVVMIFWQSIQALFLGRELIYHYNMLQICFITSSLLINVFGILFFNYDLLEIIFTFLISSAITFVFGLILLRNKSQSFSVENEIHEKSSPLFLKSTISGIFIYLAYRGPLFLINFLLGSVQAGLFSIVMIFSDMLQKLPNVAGTVLISQTVNDSNNSSEINVARLSRMMITLNIAIAIFLAFTGRYIIVLLFNDSFELSYYPLLIFSPSFVFFGAGLVYNAYFMGRAYPPVILINNAVLAVLIITLNLLLIPNYGIAGTAFSVSVSSCAWLSIYIIAFKRMHNFKVKNLLILNSDDMELIYKLIAWFIPVNGK